MQNWRQSWNTEEEAVPTEQQQADLEKTVSECEGKLKKVKGLIQDTLWSTFGDGEMTIALQAAETECLPSVAHLKEEE